MAYNNTYGFTVTDQVTLIDNYRISYNTAFSTSYTADQFNGSKEYELFYIAAQQDAQQQAYYAQLVEKSKNYINEKNLIIERPSIIYDRIIAFFKAKYNFNVSVQPISAANGNIGYLNLCIDYTASTETNQAIAQDILNYNLAGGAYTNGSITETASLTNGQSFAISWSQPTQRTVNLKYTIIRSRNTQIAQQDPTEIINIINENIANSYNLGLDIEPQNYLKLTDLNWASSIVGQQDENGTFTESVYKSSYDELFTFEISPTDIIIMDS